MEAQVVERVAGDIRAHIDKSGAGYASWYVGVTKNPQQRLFAEHGLRREGEWWIFRQAASSLDARTVEAYFINTLGTDGGTGAVTPPPSTSTRTRSRPTRGNRRITWHRGSRDEAPSPGGTSRRAR